VADEIAGAADLVKGKLGAVPVAVVRGLPGAVGDSSAVARDLVRPVDEDLFRLGTEEAITQGRREMALLAPVREFTDTPVEPTVLRWAAGAALTSGGPARLVHLADLARRKELLDEIAGADVLYAAPEIVLAFTLADPVAGGAAVHALRVALAAEGLGSCLVPVAHADRIHALLDLPESWDPLGALAIGHPRGPLTRTETDPADRLLER
jgi:coenzyme F420-0:L-glutamate ligase/coenzyme F420-1:gamma-L-glutamate ligase